MKARSQKEKELNRAEELFGKSRTLIFLDFKGVDTKHMRFLRNEARNTGGTFLVLKKRLLGLLAKRKKMDFDPAGLEGMVGTLFSPGNLEEVSGPVYRFFVDLGEDAESKKTNTAKILGAYDVAESRTVDAAMVREIGALPPREVVLGQLLGMLAAPVRGLLYLLSQKSGKVEAQA